MQGQTVNTNNMPEGRESGDVAALLAALAVLAASISAAVVVYHPGLRVATGDSMQPAIDGPAIVTCDPTVPPDDIETGDIVAAPVYRDTNTGGGEERFGASGETVMHRVIDRPGGLYNLDDALRLQGDNNQYQTELTSAAAVECVYQSHLSLSA